jgi:two-component system, chemotaxis family, chemotaxis protein CheY
MEPIRTLVVEDARSMRKFIIAGLEREIKHIEIAEAQNGKEAQQKLMSGRFSCVICDHDMPIMNGEELLHWVRNESEQRDIPFIMATATRERELLARVVKAGANACLLKPFTIDDLVHRLVDITAQVNRRQHDRFAIEGTIIFSYRKIMAKASIIDVSKGGVFGQFRITDTMPMIMERVVVDVETPQGIRMKDLDAYVVRQQAEGELPDITSVKIAARFNNLPPEKLVEVERFFSSLKLN